MASLAISGHALACMGLESEIRVFYSWNGIAKRVWWLQIDITWYHGCRKAKTIAGCWEWMSKIDSCLATTETSDQWNKQIPISNKSQAAKTAFTHIDNTKLEWVRDREEKAQNCCLPLLCPYFQWKIACALHALATSCCFKRQLISYA
jgi:hypothetical protein